MRIALIGYGKMGKAVEQIALQRGHSISAIIDTNTQTVINQDLKSIADVAIEFTSPESAKKNVYDCIKYGVPVISGTTGWKTDIDEIKALCDLNSTAFFYASNFSIGANIFMNINEKLAALFESFNDYNASIEETHHIHKLDKPSGTAITLANGIVKNNKKYVNWELNPVSDIQNIGISSFREGDIFGDHKIIWDSEIDTISISHSAKSRNGLALGAIMAAEFIKGKTGVFKMNDLLKL
jgi:4-hydroxy-tetrahydrodipicolinate reductase